MGRPTAYGAGPDKPRASPGARPRGAWPAAALIARVPSAIRFLLVGGFCSALQIALLYVLVHHAALERNVANVLAFIISTQVNFALSSVITWRERLPDRFSASLMVRRLLSYNLMSVGSLVVNEGVFAVSSRFTHYLIAGALGVAAAAGVNYGLSRAVIFRRPKPLNATAG